MWKIAKSVLLLNLRLSFEYTLLKIVQRKIAVHMEKLGMYVCVNFEIV